MTTKMKDKIDELIKAGKPVKTKYDMSNPDDVYIVERLGYFKYAVPVLIKTGQLTQNDINNSLIDMYVELREQGSIL